MSLEPRAGRHGGRRSVGPMLFRFRARILWAISRLVAAGLFRTLEVVGTAPDTKKPRLVIANHFNGLVDVVLLIVALGNYPLFIAKSTLFERLPSRLLLKMVGAIPVYRPIDGADVSLNRDAFTKVYEQWERGRTVAIFPEGTVAEEERLQPLRTGAARMALGAREQGVDDLEIVPVGITYMDKTASRSRALVGIGDPLQLADLSQLVPFPDGPLPAGPGLVPVREATAVLTDRLGSLPATYGSLTYKARLLRVADVVVSADLGHAYKHPPLSALVAISDRVAALPESAQDEVFNRMGRYHLDLANLGLRDDHLVPTVRLRDFLLKLVTTALTLLVVIPLAYVSFLTNIIPILLTVLVGTAVREPVSKGTARVLVALVTFPAAWAFTLWTSQLEGWQVFAYGGVLAVGSILIVIGVQSASSAFDAGLGWWRSWSRASLVAVALQTRADAVAYVRAQLS